MASVIKVTTANYPESDGKPMGETDEHIEETIRLRHLLKRCYEGQRVYVSGNLLVFYEQGNPKKFIVPDVLVVRGIEPGNRRIYKVWYEGKPPDAIIEVTSGKTKKKDMVAKPALYGRLGVPEYFLFDLTRDYLEPPLQGHRLISGRYVPIAADAEGALVSDQLGLRLRAEGRQLMLYCLDTGQRLLSEAEARQAAEEAQRIAEEGRRAAEAEIVRLREQLRRRDRTQSS
jgi:Uma2 family endonuclease